MTREYTVFASLSLLQLRRSVRRCGAKIFTTTIPAIGITMALNGVLVQHYRAASAVLQFLAVSRR